MVARDVQQIVIEVIDQPGSLLPAMPGQRIRRLGIGHGIALGDQQVGPMAQRLGGVRYDQVDPPVLRQMIQWQQQADIAAGGGGAVVEPLRHHNHRQRLGSCRMQGNRRRHDFRGFRVPGRLGR